MHISKILTTIIIAGSMAMGTLSAQQRYFDERSLYRQHFMYPVLVNPGATGINDYQELIVNYRSSWAGFQDAPKTITLNFNGPVGNRLGFGAQLFRDNFGVVETSKGMLAVSYTIESPTNKIGFGLTTEYIQHVVTGGAIGGSIIDPNDVLLLQRLDGNRFFDASFGIYGVYDNSLKYGVALPSLISAKLNSEDGGAGMKDLGYIVHLGYEATMADGAITVEPSVFIKSLNNIPTHADFNLRMSFLENRFTGAVGYTMGASQGLGFLIGARVDNFHLNYSYNISTRQFQDFNNGGHEITLSYTFNRNYSNR